MSELSDKPMQVPPQNYNEAMGVIFGMRAEIDRLRAEVEQFKTDYRALAGQNDRLRAEKERLWDALERVADPDLIRAILAKAAKEGE